MQRSELEGAVGGVVATVFLAMLGNLVFWTLAIAGVVLVALKVLGTVDWSWNLVLTPWLVDAVILLAIYWYAKPWESNP